MHVSYAVKFSQIIHTLLNSVVHTGTFFQNYIILCIFLAILADINECERELYDCNENASCINTPGSYQCECITKFTGDGFNCTGNTCIVNYLSRHVETDNTKRKAWY